MQKKLESYVREEGPIQNFKRQNVLNRILKTVSLKLEQSYKGINVKCLHDIQKLVLEECIGMG